MKKLLALALSLCMVASMMTVAAFATAPNDGGSDDPVVTPDTTPGGNDDLDDPVVTPDTTPGGNSGSNDPVVTPDTTPGGNGGANDPAGGNGGGSGSGGGSSSGGSGGGGGAAVVEPTPVNPFEDVAKTAYYYDAVMWILKQGITEGVTETSFDPTANCTRAQMVTFLWRAAGCPEPTGSAKFVDVPASAYYYKAVLWAVEQGITNGMTAESFVPNQVCSRGQMAAFLYRHAGAPAVAGEHDFIDVNSDNYFHAAVIWLLKEGITNGTTTTTYSPNNNCTRGQMAAFLYRYLAE